jgi:hypothetical protein
LSEQNHIFDICLHFASIPIYYAFSSFYYLLLLLRHYYYYFKKRMKKFCRKEVHGGAGKQWDAVWIHSKNEKVGFRPDNSRGSHTAPMPRNGGHPTPKDLLTELAAREDGVTSVESSIVGVAGRARFPRAVRAPCACRPRAVRAPSALTVRARRVRQSLPCQRRRRPGDEDRGVEEPVQLHLGLA